MDPTGKIAKPHKTFVTVKLYRNYAGTLKKVCKAVVAKKGAHSGF